MLKRGQFIDVSDRTVLSLLGSESLDLLQRISTNDVAKLSTDGSVQTVLANEKGRIVEVVSVVDRSGEDLLVVGQSTNPLMMKQWIEKYIIMEDIMVTILTASFKHLIAYDSTEDMRDLMSNLPQKNWRVFDEALGSAKLCHVLAPMESRTAANEWLLSIGFVESGSANYEEYRVRYGVPGFPTELSSSFNPLEAGLLHLVSFTKGCYIGQEVVARLETYKKLRRALTKLKMAGLPTNLPAKIYSQGEECGIITSAVRLRDSHECLGLGYVKTGAEISNGGLYFQNGENQIKLTVDSQGAQVT